MRLPGRFEAQQHVMFGPAGTLPPRTVTVHRVGNWAKNEEHLYCSIKLTSHWSTGYEEMILNIRGASTVWDAEN